MTRADKAIGNFFPALINKITALGDDYSNPLFEAIGKIFGISVSKKNTIDGGNYEKGPVPFDGVVKKSIVEVIPTYLSRILAAVSKDEPIAYDYESGRFKNVLSEKSKFYEDMRRNILSEYDDMDKVFDAMNEQIVDSGERKKLTEALKMAMVRMSDMKGPINPENAEDMAKLFSKDVKDPLYRNNEVSDKELDTIMSFINETLTPSQRYALFAGSQKNAAYEVKSNTLRDIETRDDRSFIRNILLGNHNNLNREDFVRGKSNANIYNSDGSLRHVDAPEVREMDENAEERLKKLKNYLRTHNRQTKIPKEFNDVIADDEVNELIENNKKYVEEHGEKFKLFKKDNAITRFLNDKLETPMNWLNEQVDKMESTMYKIIFGFNDDDGNPKTFKDLINDLGKSIKAKMKGFYDTIHEKLFGTEEGKKGIFTQIKESEFFQSMTAKGAKVKEWIKGALFGNDEKDGFLTGFKDVLTVYSGMVKEQFTSDDGIKGTLKETTKSIFNGIGQAFGYESKGVESETPIKDAVDYAASSIKGGFQRFSDLIFGPKEFKDGSANKNWLDVEALGSHIEEYAPQATANGIIGAGVGTVLSATSTGLLGNLVLGPIGGAALGFAGTFLMKSEGFQNLLFGKEDTDGSRIGGLISKKTQEWFKENKQAIGISGGVGALGGIALSGVLPGLILGGPIPGAIFGVATTMAVRSNAFQDLLFGKEDVDGKRIGNGLVDKVKAHFSKDSAFTAEDKKRILGTIGAGAITGLGLAGLLTVSPLLGVGAGIAAGLMASSKKFADKIFGVPDEKGKREGGLVNKFLGGLDKHLIKPIILEGKLLSMKVQNWFAKDIAEPIRYTTKYAFEGIKGFLSKKLSESFFVRAIKRVGGWVKNTIEWVGKGLLKATTGIIKGAFRGATNLILKGISTPIKLAGATIRGVAGGFIDRDTRKALRGEHKTRLGEINAKNRQRKQEFNEFKSKLDGTDILSRLGGGLGGQRLEGETREEYKARMKQVKEARKAARKALVSKYGKDYNKLSSVERARINTEEAQADDIRSIRSILGDIAEAVGIRRKTADGTGTDETTSGGTTTSSANDTAEGKTLNERLKRHVNSIAKKLAGPNATKEDIKKQKAMINKLLTPEKRTALLERVKNKQNISDKYLMDLLGLAPISDSDGLVTTGADYYDNLSDRISDWVYGKKRQRVAKRFDKFAEAATSRIAKKMLGFPKSNATPDDIARETERIRGLLNGDVRESMIDMIMSNKSNLISDKTIMDALGLVPPDTGSGGIKGFFKNLFGGKKQNNINSNETNTTANGNNPMSNDIGSGGIKEKELDPENNRNVAETAAGISGGLEKALGAGKGVLGTVGKFFSSAAAVIAPIAGKAALIGIGALMLFKLLTDPVGFFKGVVNTIGETLKALLTPMYNWYRDWGSKNGVTAMEDDRDASVRTEVTLNAIKENSDLLTNADFANSLASNIRTREDEMTAVENRKWYHSILAGDITGADKSDFKIKQRKAEQREMALALNDAVENGTYIPTEDEHALINKYLEMDKSEYTTTFNDDVKYSLKSLGNINPITGARRIAAGVLSKFSAKNEKEATTAEIQKYVDSMKSEDEDLEETKSRAIGESNVDDNSGYFLHKDEGVLTAAANHLFGGAETTAGILNAYARNNVAGKDASALSAIMGGTLGSSRNTGMNINGLLDTAFDTDQYDDLTKYVEIVRNDTKNADGNNYWNFNEADSKKYGPLAKLLFKTIRFANYPAKLVSSALTETTENMEAVEKEISDTSTSSSSSSDSLGSRLKNAVNNVFGKVTGFFSEVFGGDDDVSNDSSTSSSKNQISMGKDDGYYKYPAYNDEMSDMSNSRTTSFGTKPHRGLDILVRNRSNRLIKSFTGGTVMFAGQADPNDINKSYGNMVQIQDEYGMYHLYGHLKKLKNLKAGDKISAGTVLGTEGETGAANGSHLHYEVGTGIELGNKLSGEVHPGEYMKGYNSGVGPIKATPLESYVNGSFWNGTSGDNAAEFDIAESSDDMSSSGTTADDIRQRLANGEDLLSIIYSPFVQMNSALKGLVKGSKSSSSSGSSGSSGSGSGSSGSTSISGSNYTEQAWNYLRNTAGFTKNGAAGILGNMQAESGIDPLNMQNTYENSYRNDFNYTKMVDNGTYRESPYSNARDSFSNDDVGYGLVQWTYNSRKRNLYDYIKSKGLSLGDMGGQMGFLMQELNEGYPELVRLAKDKNASLDAVSNEMLLNFERPADMYSKKSYRAGLGRDILKTYGGDDDVSADTTRLFNTAPRNNTKTVINTNTSNPNIVSLLNEAIRVLTQIATNTEQTTSHLTNIETQNKVIVASAGSATNSEMYDIASSRRNKVSTGPSAKDINAYNVAKAIAHGF